MKRIQLFNNKSVNSDVPLPSYLNPNKEEREKLINKIRLKPENDIVEGKDIPYLFLILVFSFLCHLYIFRSKALYGVFSTDSTAQMIYFLPFFIRELFFNGHFYSFSYGMGGDIFSEYSYYYSTSPIVYLIVPLYAIGYILFGSEIFSMENSLRFKLLLSILKQIILMVSMYYLLKYEKRSREASLSAAFIYGGGIYYMWNSNYFDFFTDAYLWVPLMVLGYRIYQKKKNFFPLMISAALCAVNNFYFAYHTYVFFIVFVLVMTEGFGETFKKRLKSYFKQIRNLGIIGIGALLLSSFAFLPQIFAFLKIDRFIQNYPVSLFFDKSFYQNMPINLFFNSSTLGIPMIVVMIFFINYRRTSSSTNRKMVLLALFFVLYMLPFTGYFLNGMNYASERWYYLFLFVIGYCSADIVDEAKKKNYFNIIVSFILFSIFLIMIYFRRNELKDYSKYLYYNIAVVLFNILIFFFISVRKFIEKEKWRKLTDKLLMLSIAGVMLFNNFAFNLDQKLDITTEFMKEKDMVTDELKDVMKKVVPDKTEFYRTVHRNTAFENAPNLYNYYGISTFHSMTDGNMHDYFKRILNIRHGVAFLSSFNNLDDRVYLESLLGVKYIITSKDYTPPSVYKQVYENSKYALFEAKESVGFDMWFPQNIDLDTFLSLPVADKDVNLLNYAITEEDYNSKFKGTPIEIPEYPINTDTVKYEGVDQVGDTITVKPDGKIKFIFPERNINSQVYISFHIRPENRDEYEIKMNHKRAFKASESNPYVYPTYDYTFVLNGEESPINWSVNERKYEFNKLQIKRVDISNHPALIAARNKYNMENLIVDGDKISGIVENNEAGFMVFNIPYNKGWHLKVNGKATELKRMNGFLSGVMLEPGVNKIELRFIPRGLIEGAIISGFTLIIALIYYKLTKNKRMLLSIKEEDMERRLIKERILNQNLESARRVYLKNKITERNTEVINSSGISEYNHSDNITENNESITNTEITNPSLTPKGTSANEDVLKNDSNLD